MTKPSFHAGKRIRNGMIASRYRRGETQRALAAAFGLAESTVQRIIRVTGAQIPATEHYKRIAAGLQLKLGDRDWLERRNASVRRAKSVWPDCPPELQNDYDTLRQYHSAREARAMLERQL